MKTQTIHTKLYWTNLKQVKAHGHVTTTKQKYCTTFMRLHIEEREPECHLTPNRYVRSSKVQEYAFRQIGYDRLKSVKKRAHENREYFSRRDAAVSIS
uniref:Uncharacterized protein n=1 Tax=Anguilla anguilla TaxID=7936 RepID=A0A0E9WYU8_ANGAN